MTSFAARLYRTRPVATTGRGVSATDGNGDVRLFLTAYAAGFVFLFVLLG